MRSDMDHTGDRRPSVRKPEKTQTPLTKPSTGTSPKEKEGHRHATDDPEMWGELHHWLLKDKLKIRTGFPTLDRVCAGGLMEGTFNTLGGVDSSGKSLVCLSIALEAAAAGHNVGIVNLDMEWRLWYLRTISKMGNLSAAEILETDQRDAFLATQIKNAMNRVMDLPGKIVLDDSMPAKVGEVCEVMESLARKDRCKLIVVDYLQIIDPDRNASLVEGFNDVCKALRRRGKADNVALIAASQLNRKGKTDDAPHVYHTYGGNALERHGDINMVIDHRERVLNDREIAFKIAVEKNRITGRCWRFEIARDKHSLHLREIQRVR